MKEAKTTVQAWQPPSGGPPSILSLRPPQAAPLHCTVRRREAETPTGLLYLGGMSELFRILHQVFAEAVC